MKGNVFAQQIFFSPRYTVDSNPTPTKLTKLRLVWDIKTHLNKISYSHTCVHSFQQLSGVVILTTRAPRGK